MISGGDELGRTQRGNNNAYCQDNEISWSTWKPDEKQKGFLEFFRGMIHFRREQLVLRRRNFFQGRDLRGEGIKDIAWFEPSGKEMTDEAWNQHFVRCLGVLLSGDAIDELSEEGEPIHGDTLLLLMNAHHDLISFLLPRRRPQTVWEAVLDTALEPSWFERARRQTGASYDLQGRSVAVLREAAPS